MWKHKLNKGLKKAGKGFLSGVYKAQEGINKLDRSLISDKKMKAKILGDFPLGV